MFVMKLLVVFCLLFVDARAITLTDGRYEDVYIVIQDSIQENLEILDRIQDVFTKASQLLFTATKNQAYFGKIKVVIPKSWSSLSQYKLLPALSSLNTHITVDEGFIKTPHVRSRTNKCGEEGWYMYLTPAFLLETGITKWGKHENVIVRLWGHLRWGLFDEYPDPLGRLPHFYQHAGEWKPASCSEQLQGTVGIGPSCSTSHAEMYCNIKKTWENMHSTCYFCPHEEQNTNISLLSYQYIQQITAFCDKNDDTVSEDQRHNSDATNTQNLFCNSRSAWEVMREHDDFKDTSPLPSTSDTVPEFEFIQETDGFRIFVLDVSGSMGTNDRIGNLYQTAEYIIQEKIPVGSWLGIVTFSTLADRVKSLTQVNSIEDRDDLVQALPTTVGGSTCIGCGIDEAVLMLTDQLESPENGEIIVISDGQNNRGDLDLSRANAVDAKVVIHTIAVSQQADTTLADIAIETGGKHFTYLETGSISFAAAFSEIISDGLTSTASQSATLVSEKIESVSLTTNITLQFSIEEGLGKNTTIIVLTKITGNIELELYGPNNYKQNVTVNGTTATLRVPDIAQVGDYNLTITIPNIGQTVEYYVTTTPTVSDNSVIRVVSRLSNSTIDFSTDGLPVVFVHVTKGYAPILNATVNAILDSSTPPCTLTLYDDGIDPDKLKDDGSYSGYIWPWCLNSGRVNIKVHVSGIGGETILLKSETGSVSPNTDEAERETISDSFQRVVVTEELYILNYNYDTSDTKDVIAPGRITDVKINNIETATTLYGENRNFTITWTATGDDKNNGQATSYEMKISNNSIYLRDNFELAESLNMTNGTLNPQVIGATEALKIVVDAEESYTETMYFAVRAVDEADNIGPVSNIVPIVIARGFRASGEQGYAISDTDDVIVLDDITPSQTNDESDVKYIINIIIGVSVTGTVLLIVGVVCLCVKKSVAKKAAVEDSQLSLCTKSSSMTEVEPFYSKQHEHASTKLPYSRQLKTFDLDSPAISTRVEELNRQDSSKIETTDSDHTCNDAKLQTKVNDETVVDIEDESSEFGDPDEYITETTKRPFPLCKLPFHMTNKALPIKTSGIQEGVKNDHITSVILDQNEKETVVDIEDESSEFGDPDDYITETTKLSFPLCKPPFHLTNKALPIQTSGIQDGVKNAQTTSVILGQNEKEKILETFPALPFSTDENMDRSHPPPNIALHILKPNDYGLGKKPYAFPVPFSGVASTLNISTTMIANFETTDDILNDEDIQTDDDETVSGETDSNLSTDDNGSQNEYLSRSNENGMSVVIGGCFYEDNAAYDDAETFLSNSDDQVSLDNKASSKTDEVRFINKEYTKKVEGSLYTENHEAIFDTESSTEKREDKFENEAYSDGDVISSHNEEHTEKIEVKSEIESYSDNVEI